MAIVFPPLAQAEDWSVASLLEHDKASLGRVNWAIGVSQPSAGTRTLVLARIHVSQDTCCRCYGLTSVVLHIDPQLILLASEQPKLADWARSRVSEPYTLVLVLPLRENHVSVVDEVGMQTVTGFLHFDLDKCIWRIDLALSLYRGIIEATTTHGKRIGSREQGKEVEGRARDN